jgi:hypothetical protein
VQLRYQGSGQPVNTGFHSGNVSCGALDDRQSSDEVPNLDAETRTQLVFCLRKLIDTEFICRLLLPPHQHAVYCPIMCV